jgi:uncharacterized protein (DUF1499 family)
MIVNLLKWLVFLVVGLAIALLAAGQLGLLKGSAPASLGVRDGRLQPPSPTPNSVSSQASLYPGHPQLEYARIAPLRYAGDGKAAFAKVVAAVRGLPRTVVVKEEPGYLYAQCTTRWLGFTDDLELLLDEQAQVIHVRSASRLGEGDLGVNRARVETIRLAVGAL